MPLYKSLSLLYNIYSHLLTKFIFERVFNKAINSYKWIGYNKRNTNYLCKYMLFDICHSSLTEYTDIY